MTVGADILANFEISPVDFLGDQPGGDLCDRGADGYMVNHAADSAHGDEPWAKAHFCPDAFGTEEHLQARYLTDIDCTNFELDAPDGGKEYRVSNEMEPFAATVLHEIIHFNGVARAATDLPKVSFGSRHMVLCGMLN